MFSQETVQLLGLSAAENRLLKTLQSGEFSVTDLSKTTKIKRTSLYPLLKKLKARGLVTTRRHGRRHRWHATSKQRLQTKLFSLAHHHEVTEETGDQIVGIIPSQNSEYHVYHGRAKLVQIYEEIGHLPRHTRLYGIQPNVSALSVMKKFPYDRLVQLNQNIKDREIIVEGVLQENFLDYWSSHLKKQEVKRWHQLMKAYSGRLAVTTYVPADQLNFNSEIMFYENVVIIANWQDLTAAVIKNQAITGIMTELFESLKTIGRRTDQNPRVAQLLKSR